MPSHAPGARLLPYLIISNLLTLLLLVVISVLYLDTRRLNELLLEQRPATLQPERAVAPVTRSSAPVVASAVKPSVERPLLEQVPANLAEGAEVLVISGYDSASEGGGIVSQVDIDRPGKAVVVVLTSYERIAWQVRPTADTRLKGIIVAAHEKPKVAVDGDVPVYQSKLTYAAETESSNFVTLLRQLKDKHGITRIDAFRGNHDIPAQISITQINPDDPRLSAAGEAPDKPIRDYAFELLGPDRQVQRWSLNGPDEDTHLQFVSDGKQAQDRHGHLFALKGHDLSISDSSTGRVLDNVFPDNFPRLSWPTDLAYDSRRDLVTLVSLGGEGYLYRYDAKANAWLDFRSLQNTDLQSLAYDPQADRYVGWTSWGSLYFISGEGVPMGSKDIIDRLKGFKRLYDHANRPAPPVLLVPRGDQLAIVALQGKQVAAIWYYDLELDIAQLTYHNPRLN